MVFGIKKQDRPEKTEEKVPLTAVFITRLKDWQSWLALVMTFVVLEIAVFSVEQVHWITPQPSLTLALVLSVAGTWALAASRLPRSASHVILIIAGIIVSAWQASALLPYPEWTTRFSQLIPTLRSLITAAPGTPADDNVLFASFLSVLTWFIGYISAWSMARRRNPWIAVSLGGFMLLVNLSNLPDTRFWLFALYCLAAVFLAAAARAARLVPADEKSRRGWVYLVSVTLVLVIIGGTVTWALPELRAPALQSALAKNMLWKHNLEASRLNVFATVPSKQPIATSATGRSLPLEETWHLDENIEFIIRADSPSYWRIRAYDTYSSSEGWSNAPATEYLLEKDRVWGNSGAEKSPAVMRYRVETNVKTDILLTGGNFLAADSPSIVQAQDEDVISVRAPRILAAGEQYVVTSVASTPPGDTLAGIASGYPEGIGARYLSLPPDFPSSVRRLARDVTRGAATPYKKIMAIKDYLSSFSYSNSVIHVPNTDLLQSFLFTDKSGFCLYFASAMAVMLRSVGVPARLAVGYLPGEPGDEPGVYILRDKHYHAWPQAYFKGYGWVDLEATPTGSASPVSVSAPIVSNDVVAELPAWESWNELLGIYGFVPPGEFPPPPTPAPSRTFGAFSFADELGRVLAVIFGGILLLVLLATPLLAVRSRFQKWIWHVNRAELGQTAYQKMCSLAAIVKLGPMPQQTPWEYASYLGHVFPGEAKAIDHITRLYTETKFGRRGRLGLFEEAELLKARCTVYDTLLARLGFAGKLTVKRK